MDVKLLEQELSEARSRLERICDEIGTQSPTAPWETKFQAGVDDCLRLERLIAEARGEPAAVDHRELPSPMVKCGYPFLVQRNGVRLVYQISEARELSPEPENRPRISLAPPIALIEFELCIAAKMGSPNDEVASGHPLYGRGLGIYGRHRIVRSNWIRELERMNSVHSAHSPEYWLGYEHYVISFEDCTFECVARGTRISVFDQAFEEVCQVAVAQSLR